MAETDDIVRWTVKVSRDTDISLRSFLAQRGMKKGDLSKFIERAVQKEVFAQTVAGIQAPNAGVPEVEIQGAIEDARRQQGAEQVTAEPAGRCGNSGGACLQRSHGFHFLLLVSVWPARCERCGA
jgi:Ribbon-helix-helix domain